MILSSLRPQTYCNKFRTAVDPVGRTATPLAYTDQNTSFAAPNHSLQREATTVFAGSPRPIDQTRPNVGGRTRTVCRTPASVF